eukprot:g11839.t1
MLELGKGVCGTGRGLLSKEMSTEAKTAEEQFSVMLCPKFVKVGMQRDNAEAFAEYRAFRIRERKIRRDGEHSIRSNSNFVIKPADKGGAVVVWHTDLYLVEAERQLSDTSSYLPLDHDPT